MNGNALWGIVDATRDWCEANYAVSPYIAEFGNTLSSVPILLFALFGLIMTHRFVTSERRFYVLFCILASVGIGSIFFHGTLRRFAQMFDEIPMLLSNFGFLYCFLENARERKYRWLPLLLSAVAGCVVIIYGLRKDFTFFLATYTVTGLFIVAMAIHTLLRQDTPLLAKRLFAWFVGLYSAGFLCWTLDNQYCTAVEHWYFHAWWHLLAGFGTYCYILFFVALRLHTFGLPARIAFRCGLPYVRRG